MGNVVGCIASVLVYRTISSVHGKILQVLPISASPSPTACHFSGANLCRLPCRSHMVSVVQCPNWFKSDQNQKYQTLSFSLILLIIVYTCIHTLKQFILFANFGAMLSVLFFSASQPPWIKLSVVRAPPQRHRGPDAFPILAFASNGTQEKVKKQQIPQETSQWKNQSSSKSKTLHPTDQCWERPTVQFPHG